MKKALYFLLFLSLFISSANAMIFSVDEDPFGICGYDQDYILITEGTDLTKWTKTGSDSAKVLYDAPDKIVDVDYNGESFFYVLQDGRVYMTEDTGGLLNHTSSLALPDPETYLLGDISGGISTHMKCVLDADSNLYVSSGTAAIYKFSAPSYTQTSYSSGSPRYVHGMAAGQDGLLFQIDYDGIYVAPDPSTKTLVKDFGSYSQPFGLFELDNQNLIFANLVSSTVTIYEGYNYSDYTSLQTIGSVSGGWSDIYVDADAVIYCVNPTTNEIITFGTFSGVGGYAPFDLTSSSGDDSSSSSNTTSTLDLGDSHEYTNDEITTILRQNVPPIFIIILLFFFLYVIGGK